MNNVIISIMCGVLIFISGNVNAQCANNENIYSFTYGSANYEIVKENQNWEDAAACAVERGGYLAEIGSEAEQNAVFSGVSSAGIELANTVAPDGGGASYVWLGGSDIEEEGKWVWNGNNDSEGIHFFQGKYPSGQAVDSLFNNWGNEPDNWGDQDGLGLALTDWPLGVISQWNDVSSLNELYYVIEYDPQGVNDQKENKILVYPNPANDQLFIKGWELIKLDVYNQLGILILQMELSQNDLNEVDVSRLNPGLYILSITTKGGDIISSSFVKK